MQITATSRFPYLFYVLTVSGVAYVLKIRNVSMYASCSIFPADELMELTVHDYSNHIAVTAVTATSGCLVVGRNDGSVCCFQIGVLDPSAPGMINLVLYSQVIVFATTCMFPFPCILFSFITIHANVICISSGKLSLLSYFVLPTPIDIGWLLLMEFLWQIISYSCSFCFLSVILAE